MDGLAHLDHERFDRREHEEEVKVEEPPVPAQTFLHLPQLAPQPGRVASGVARAQDALTVACDGAALQIREAVQQPARAEKIAAAWIRFFARDGGEGEVVDGGFADELGISGREE